MQRSRYSSHHSSESPFTRRDGISERREENRTVELFFKFRTFRPYLKNRLTKICKDGRERELRDEVEDIKYYLSVMSDMLADENHGAATLQGFIDRIHEMIRKNPSNDSFMSNQDSPETSDIEEIDQNGHSMPPRSPSPTEIIDSLSEVPATARTIPLEREQKEFSYFASLEETLEKQIYEKKKKPTSRTQWEPERGINNSDPYNNRSSHRDVDMRGDDHYNRSFINTVPLGRGSGMTRSNQWEDCNGSRSSFGRGGTRDENHYDLDERFDRSFSNNNNYFGAEGNYGNRNIGETYRDVSGNWNSFGRGRSGNTNNDFDRVPSRDSREFHNHHQTSDRREHYSRDYSRDRQFASYSREPSYDSTRTQDNALFDRRPQFDRRERNPSSNNSEVDGSVQIDYNHGGSADEQTWDGVGSTGGTTDRDMRGITTPSQPSPVANMFPPIFDASQQQQMFLNSQNLNFGINNQQPMNAFIGNQSILQGINPMMGMNIPVQNLQPAVGVPNIGMQSNINIQNARPMGHTRFGQNNNRPGLLPTPGALPHQTFSFRSPTSQSQPPIRVSQTSIPETYLPPGNELGQKNSSPPSSMMMEISKQKAQQCFSRISAQKKDNQNVPPTSTGRQSTTLGPSHKTSQESLIASNQMLSDRDPRLNRLHSKKNNQVNSTSQNDSHHSQNSRTSKPVDIQTTVEPKRGEQADPRLTSRPREDNRYRNRNTSGDRRPSSKFRDDIRDNNFSSEHKNTDETRDRYSRVASDQINNKNTKKLDEIRSRVRDSIPPSKQNTTSKLQEIRKQVEKEGYHPLGRPPAKKKPFSFDEAINVPVDIHPRPPLKSPTKSHLSRESSREKGLENSVLSHKKSHKEKSREASLNKGNQSKNVSPDKINSKGKKGSKKREKQRHSTSSHRVDDSNPSQLQTSAEVTKKPTYRIPKIKRPEPVVVPPPPRSPSPPPPPPPTITIDDDDDDYWENSYVPQNINSSELIKDENIEDNALVTLSESPVGRLNIETENLIKEFIRQSLVASEADNIIRNPEAINLVFQKLKAQVQQMCHDEPPPLPSTVSGSQATDKAESVESATEIQDHAVTSELNEPKEQETSRSRSTIRKKSTKRRSSLEKLHDALKEMRFDTMLPLGPRRCTRQGEESQAAPQASVGAKELTPPSKNPQILLNKDDFSQILASTENSTRNESSTSMKVNDGPDVLLDSETALGNQDAECTPSVGRKRGPKRKRKGSKIKPNKKKKGPVTRAQAAVKSAIKIQHKDKGSQPTSDPSETHKKKKKLSGENDSLKSEVRVTRSMIGRTTIVANLGLEKIKIESDFIPEPKLEPLEDPSFGECITAGTGLEHLEDDVIENSALVEDSSDKSLEVLDIPSFDFDIKSEPENDSNLIDTEIEEQESIQISIDEDNIETDVVKTEAESDMDYNITDWSLLPDIPNIDSVFSFNPAANNDVLHNLISKIDDENEEYPSIEHLRDGDNNRSILDDCKDLMNWMISTVEYQVDESIKNNFQSKLCSLMKPSKVNLAETSSETVPLVVMSDDDEVAEPNDFYYDGDSEEDDSGSSYFSDDEKPPINSQKFKATPITNCNNNGSYKRSHCEQEDVLNIYNLREFRKKRFPTNEHDDDDDESYSVVEHSLANATKDVLKSAEDLNDKRLNDLDTSVMKAEKEEDADGIFDNENGRVTHLEGHLLYKCANLPCRFTAANSVLFKDHIITCTFATENGQVSCFHCDKRVKAIPNLLEHLKVHGRKKQRCALCPFRTWVNSELTRHLKTCHKVYTYKVEKVELEDDEDPDFVVYPKEVASKIITLQELKESYAQYADRLVFGPDDYDKVPARHIFHNLAYCSMCSYSSKVRVNFIRHIKAHKAALEQPDKNVPKSDPVNPVPCLERKELMFDKMTNWAGSTHAHKPGPANDNSALPQFVSEQFRYVCSVSGCEQITTDEYMLRAHMRALHSEVDVYNCPHCDKHELTRMDKRNVVPVDKLGNHLKLHGSKLYRCAYCDVIHTQVTLMEKHLPEKHPEKKPIHYLIRNLDANGQLSDRVAEKWRCALCSSKTLFCSYDEVKTHCRLTHRVYGQFSCGFCKHYTDSDASMKNHILSTCSNKRSAEGQIMILWYRNEFDMKPDDIFRGPIWKRTSQNIKHIRGIFLEDVKEKSSKIDSMSISKPSASAQSSAETVSGTSNSGTGNTKKSTQPKSTDFNAANSTGKATKQITGQTLAVQSAKPQLLMVCPKCNIYKTKNEKDMSIHLYNELSYQRYRCTKCNLKFVTESSLKGHYTGDHGMTYNTQACELLPVDTEIENYVQDYFDQQNVLLKISEDVEKKPVEGQIRCKHCGQDFQSSHNLRTHVLAKHIAQNRYKCNHCSQTFYNEPLVRSHHYKTHKDLPLSHEQDVELQNKLTPAFWEREYGILTKKTVKKDLFQTANDKEELLEEKKPIYQCHHCVFDTNDSFTLEAHLEECHNEDSNNFLFELPDDPPPTTGNKDDGIFDSSEALKFLDDLLGDGSLPPSRGHRTENANVYKCFHCKDNFFTVRGARNHWKRAHSRKPEERCNYYEYKAFNKSMELPAWMELCCSHCDYKVSSMILMKSHHQAAHSNLVFRMKRRTRVGNNVYVCAHCMHESSSVPLLEDHHVMHHPDVQLEYSIIDIQNKDKFDDDECFGKLIEDTVRYSCLSCENEFESRVDCKNHQLTLHFGLTKEPTTKYSRHVINPRIKVPADSDVHDVVQVFQCPVCDFKSEDRQKLVTDHLNEHIRSYTCPICDHSFRSYLDTKFHIRHSHSDPSSSPLINRDMFQAREVLESAIGLVPP